jgi:hypothetical protein
MTCLKNWFQSLLSNATCTATRWDVLSILLLVFAALVTPYEVGLCRLNQVYP